MVAGMLMGRRAVGWTVAQVLYWIGHGISRVMNGPQAYVLYPVYNHCMVWSCSVNDWAGLSLWQAAKTTGRR